ncbi:DUF4439 domain-containing protein, partial [Nostoc sp.]|uniref:DUF4439 domain-containing protein n=1 Tax=Nostoc sp. TaxID=1180 RepID=UPI002FF8A2F5
MNYQSPLSKNSSRRALIVSGAVGGIATALGLPLIAQKADARTTTSGRNDAKILNNALYYEHQAIWAYGAAAGKLTSTEVGKAVLALALRNQADHKNHRDALAATIASLGGTPIKTQSSYDVSGYIKKGEGNLDSDVNIAKLALALVESMGDIIPRTSQLNLGVRLSPHPASDVLS